MAREYGYQNDLDTSTRSSNFLGNAALTGGGLFALGNMLKPWARKNIAEDIYKKLAYQEHQNALDGIVDPAFNAMARTIREEGLHAADVTSMTALKYAFGHSPIMDAIEFASTHIKPVRVFDQILGLQLLRETYGKKANLFQDLGTLSDNLALHTPEQGTQFQKLERTYREYLENVDKRASIAHGRTSIADKNADQLRLGIRKSRNEIKRRITTLNDELLDLRIINKGQYRSEVSYLHKLSDRYNRFRVRKQNQLFKRLSKNLSDVERDKALRPKIDARYQNAKGSRLFYAQGAVFSVEGEEVKRLDGAYNLYGTKVRGKATQGRWYERSVAALQGSESSEDLHAAKVAQWGFGSRTPIESQKYINGKRNPYYRKAKPWEGLTAAREEALHGQGWFQKFKRTFDIGLNTTSQYKKGGIAGILDIPSDIYSSIKQKLTGDLFEDSITKRDPDLLAYRAIRRFTPDLAGVMGALFGGRKAKILPMLSGYEMNNATVSLFHYMNRVNNIVANNKFTSWLALSGRSAATPFHFAGSILFKRALPIFAAGFYLNWAKSALTRHTGVDPDRIGNEVNYHANMWWSGVKEKLGINRFFRSVDELSGGAINYIAHPFRHQQVGMSPEEYREHQEHGYEEVRKGRWWWFGSGTPFRGERIQYFTPTSLRKSRAGNLYQTDTLWGSHDEYFANAALPTPDHPFAPIRHFLTGKYHFERKHYNDRPYPLTAPLFEPTSPWGAILNPTLGRLIKPSKWMHDDDVPYILHGRHKGEPNPKYRGDRRSVREQLNAQENSTPYVGFVTPSGQIEPMAVTPIPGAPYAIDQLRKTRGDYQARAAERVRGRIKGAIVGEYGDGASAITPYGSGAVKARKAVGELNKYTKEGYYPEFKRGARRFTGGALLENITPPGFYKDQDPNSPRMRKKIISPNDSRYQAGLGYYSATEIGGMYGFMATSATGDIMANRPTIAEAGRMTSFERTYWDRLNSGGLLPTPGLSEAFRRFLPHRYHSNSDYNPIRNTMAPWLPGTEGADPGYFMDFLHGDPYTKVPNGEIRLPGASYEKLHGIERADLRMRGSQLGYDENHMYQYLTQQREPFSPFMEDIMESGTRIHSNVQARWRKQGILEGAEVAVYDKKYNISGTMDAMLKLENGQRQVAEIKTLSDQRWQNIIERHQADQAHLQQLNFYMHETGVHTGKLVYIRRSDGKEVDVNLKYNPKLWNESVAKLQRVRARINNEIDDGQWGQGALYNDVDKLRILADVAPWSSQYKRYRDYLVHLDEAGLSPADRAEVREIKRQVSLRKDRYNFAPYKLKYSQLTDRTVTVKDVIAPGVFTTTSDSLHPIKLAGIRVNGDGAAELRKHIRPGARVHIGVAADPTQRVSSDTLHTQRAVLYSGGRNINRELIEKGYATDTDENTPAGIHVHYTPLELRVGSFFEWLGHLPIPVIHNKFLPIDSPLELYKRTQVYGKDWQDWRHPYSDFIKPAIESWAQQGPFGVAMAGTSAFLFLSGSPRAQKLLFNASKIVDAPHKGLVNGLSVEGEKWVQIIAGDRSRMSSLTNRKWLALGFMTATVGTQIYRNATGNAVPSYRQKERDINEYFDILKYLKYEGLYEGQRRFIERHEHHDIGSMLDRYEAEGEYRKRSIQVLKSKKRKLLNSPMRKLHRQAIRDINNQIKYLSNFREEIRLTRADALAIQYRNMAKTTLYGADSQGDLRKILLSMPAKEREFFQEFVKAPLREHKEILKVVPPNERRFLQAAWGLKPDERPDLKQYFKSHYLPGSDWSGWSIHRNLDDYRLIVMKHEAVDMTSQGFWPQDEARVASENLLDIRPMRPTHVWHGENIRQQLEDVTNGAGLTDAEVQIVPNQFGQTHVTMELSDSRRRNKKDRKETGSGRLF